MSSRFRETIPDVATLQALLGPPSELSLKKQRTDLDEHMQAFVRRAPFLLLGTVGKNGQCDVSPRGDIPAAAHVLDPATLVLAERPGNRRADSLRNIVETGEVGLLLLVPGIGETLRVNGIACVTRDDAVLTPLAIDGKKPQLAIGVEIRECFFQCAKALLRSRLWGTHPTPSTCTFDFARVLLEETKIEGQTVESLKEQIDTSYRERLF